MAHQGKNRPAWKTDPNSFFHPNTHTAFLIVCPIVIAIAAGVFALCFSFTYDVLTAPYHIKTEARLDKITSGVTEKWEYIEGKDEARNPNQRTTRTYQESVYSYHWTFYVDDIPHEYISTSSFGGEHKVGDTESMLFWSCDGEEYFRTYGTGLNYVLMFVSAAVMLAALFVIVRIIVIKIKIASEKAEKQKRREAQEPPVINLGNFDGKRVQLTDRNGDVFEGIGTYNGKDYTEHEFGVREPSLQIANFLFYRSDVKDIKPLKNSPYSAPYGRIEEMNYLEGIDTIEEELFCEEDEHVFRMLTCLEDHVVNRKEECAGLAEVLRQIPTTTLSEKTRRKAESLLNAIKNPI